MFYTAPESSYYYEYLHPLIQFHNFLKIPVKKPQTTLIVRNRLLLDSFAVDLSKIYSDFFIYILFWYSCPRALSQTTLATPPLVNKLHNQSGGPKREGGWPKTAWFFCCYLPVQLNENKLGRSPGNDRTLADGVTALALLHVLYSAADRARSFNQ